MSTSCTTPAGELASSAAAACPAVTEIEVSKVASSSIEQVFADPAGNHMLLLMKVNNTYETHYLHRWDPGQHPRTAASTTVVLVLP